MIYEFDLLVEGYKPDVMSMLLIFYMMAGTVTLFYFQKYTKVRLCFLAVSFVLVFTELSDISRYYGNIKALKTGGLESIIGRISFVDDEFQLRITSEVEYFFVDGLKISFDVKGSRYAYNVPISKNEYIQVGNYFEGYFNGKDLVQLRIFDQEQDQIGNVN